MKCGVFAAVYRVHADTGKSWNFGHIFQAWKILESVLTANSLAASIARHSYISMMSSERQSISKMMSGLRIMTVTVVYIIYHVTLNSD